MAGSVTLEHQAVGHVRKVIATCVGDAADGSIPATELPRFEGRLLALVTNPGATAPTDNYDLTLVNQNGYDVLQGVGANRSTSATQTAPVVYSGTGTHPAICGSDTLTLTFANQAVNDADIVVEIYYALGA